jgi:hypothetical protein
MIKRETFNGGYHGVVPSVELNKGWISDGLNMRKLAGGVGWKPRKGCTLHNSTQIAAKRVRSLYQYTNPKQEDYHFIAQCNSLLYDATNDPPTGGTTFGTSLGVTASDSAPGFSCLVGEYWFYADGISRPVAYGGTSPGPMAFYVEDGSADAFISYSREVIDGRSDTVATILDAAADMFYVVTQEPISGITLDLEAVNSADRTLTVKAWRSSAWAAVSDLSDGTDDSGTLAQNGTISWTTSSSDTMTVVGKDLGYAYQFSWDDALSQAVTVKSCTVTQAAGLMTNKWDGVFNWVTGCMFYDQSGGVHTEALGKVGNETTSQYVSLSEATNLDALYIKTPEPATGFGIGVVADYNNTADAQIASSGDVFYWNGSAWTSVGTITDTTLDGAGDSSFSQTGRLFFDATAISPKMRTYEGDNVEGYWYKIMWDSTLSEDTRIYALYYAPFPEDLPTVDGVVEFKGRLFLWGMAENPNRLLYSSVLNPFGFSGSDSGLTDVFGSMRPVKAAVRFYNELAVFKQKGVFLLEGYSPETFGTLKLASTIGLCSVKSLQVVEVGYAGMHEDEVMTILIWQDVDGVYICDGRKPKKISGPVDQFFNPESSDCISATNIDTLESFVDRTNNEYHLLLPDKELVYNYVTEEWYPPWEREIDLTCGLSFLGSDDREYTYGGTAGGLVCRLENDTTDKTTANADKLITQKIKTRGIMQPESEREEAILSLDFDVDRIWVRGKAQAAGTITTKVFKDMASSGTEVATPNAISMVASGKSMFHDEVGSRQSRCNVLEVEFSSATADREMEIWGFSYEIDIRGLDN